MAAIANQMTWISLQPVAGALDNGYGKGASWISGIGMTYMVIFVIVNYPAFWVIGRFGLRVAVILGMGLSAIGMVVKCLINNNFYWVIVG